MTSVVLDDDLIARLGVGSLNHLRDQVLDCIVRAKVNKTYVMQTLFETSLPRSSYTQGGSTALPLQGCGGHVHTNDEAKERH